LVVIGFLHHSGAAAGNSLQCTPGERPVDKPKLLSAIKVYNHVLSKLRDNCSRNSGLPFGETALTSSATVLGLFIPISLASCVAYQIKACQEDYCCRMGTEFRLTWLK
jgi:hypothetical protein